MQCDDGKAVDGWLSGRNKRTGKEGFFPGDIPDMSGHMET